MQDIRCEDCGDDDNYWREGDQECKRWRGADGKWEQECWEVDQNGYAEGENEIFSAEIEYMEDQEASLYVYEDG